MGRDGAWLIIDDTALPKKARPRLALRRSTLRRWQKCELPDAGVGDLASGEVPLRLSLRLFLPESWTSDVARMAKASVTAPLPWRSGRHLPLERLRLPSLTHCVESGSLWSGGTAPGRVSSSGMTT